MSGKAIDINFPEPKLTKGCRQVLQLLQKSHILSSAQDIHGMLRGDNPKAPGLTTVYRSLESLVAIGLVQAVDFGDKERRYELVAPGEHHHHLLCDHCGSSVHLDQCLVQDLEEAIKTTYGFQIRAHVLEIFGSCANCRKTKTKR